jgi:hypothetical protein
VAYILISKALALKHMAQMAIAVSADNLYPPTIGIRLTPHRTLNLIIKTGPAAMGGEFVLRPVQRAITLFTAIETLGPVVGVLAYKWRLCALVQDHILLFSI